MADESAELWYIPRGGRDPRARSWSFVEIRGACWEWTGGLDRTGYGHFQYRVALNQSRQVVAHRFAWETFYGPIPNGLIACHSCDNRKCVRPAHLWLGTDQDNSDDKWAKGRDNLAARVWSPRSRGSRLTREQAADIRIRLGMGQSPYIVADAFGISYSMVNLIARGKRWSDG